MWHRAFLRLKQCSPFITPIVMPFGNNKCHVVAPKIFYMELYKGTIGQPVLSSHSKIDKIKILKTNGSLMKVKSIAECSSAILLTCIKG